MERLDHATDWLTCRVRGGRFEGFGGPFMLEEILRIFLDWACAGPARELQPSG